MTVGVDRFEGYRDAVREAGGRVRQRLVVNGDFGKESGARAMRELTARAPDLDAVFVANDPMAMGPSKRCAPWDPASRRTSR
ncbi:MAG TPA: substrate-binding domain-containing protein [Gaiellaceae bacterium]|nr:substrate-binding domain-containing protein [Gaiellaceae bacterium]